MGRYNSIPDTRKTHGNAKPSFGDIVYHVRDFNMIHDDFPIQVFICDKYVRLVAVNNGFEFFKYYVDSLTDFLHDLVLLKHAAYNVEFDGCGKTRLSEYKSIKRKPYKFEELWIKARNKN